jgi:hypothetical protein
MTDLARAARADRAFRKGAREIIAWVGRCLWLAVRTVIRTVIGAVRMAHEQVSMWECVLLTSGTAPLTAAGPLRWVPSLDGHRPAGSHPPAQDPGEPGGNPRRRPRAKISTWAPAAGPPGTSRATGPPSERCETQRHALPRLRPTSVRSSPSGRTPGTPPTARSSLGT